MAGTTLEGHGRPNVFLAGQVGQKYKDLDSGLEYVCRGERGFIKVDGDDQSEMYNWELVESGGSTGGGVEIFPVHLTQFSDAECRCDKTIDEIKQAAEAGKLVIGFLSVGEGTIATLNYDVSQHQLYSIGMAWAGTTGVTSLAYSSIYFDNTTSTWKVRNSTFDVTPVGVKA